MSEHENDIEREALVLWKAKEADDFCFGCGRYGCVEFGCTDTGRNVIEPKVDNGRPSSTLWSPPSLAHAVAHVACDACGLEMRGAYLGGDPCPRTFECAGELGPVCAECKAINSPRFDLCSHATDALAVAYDKLARERMVKP